MNIRKLLRKDFLIFMIGLALICYPIISNYIESQERSNLISTYDSTSNNLSKTQKENMLNDAKKWNENLYLKQTGMYVEDTIDYANVLNVGNGVMGSIEIPEIKVNMPIYHGTDDNVLNIGIGHVDDSSLPVGGENTHAVLTGHSGLPSNKLFTRLDELKKDDLFYIKIFDKTFAYQVDKIETVLPEKATYEIENGKDLVTLVTCTPYGINTHRLMVTGHRVPYKKSVKQKIKQNIPSIREILLYTLPIIFTAIGIVVFKKRKERN